jgi:putative hydrolase
LIYDFHMHTFFSDGELSPVELARRALVNGYKAMAFTDHASPANIESLIDMIRRDRAFIESEWGFTALVGVELTYVPASAVGRVAEMAKKVGAEIVVVHGETIVEPVEPGINRAVVECPFVDILAHPGLITEVEARLALENNVYLEITSRRGHSLTNGHVARIARETGAKLVIDSDTHSPSDLHTEAFLQSVAIGAGLTFAEIQAARFDNPEMILSCLRPGSK